MNITKESIVGQLVAENYRYSTVFKAHKIDFCCNGNRTILDTCKNDEEKAALLIEKLQEAGTVVADNNNNYQAWPLDLLADYIEKTHHRYVVTRIEEIKPFADKVARVHGERHPELLEIRNLFYQSAQDLTHHLKKEEQILFPFIRNMVAAQTGKQTIDAPHFGTVGNPIAVMHQEHDAEGERFRQIAALTNNYTPPADACSTYKVLFALLQEFENDLHLHIHLENNILFPKAIEMEKNISAIA